MLRNELHGSGSKEKEILIVAKMIFKIGPEVLNGDSLDLTRSEQ